MRIVILYAMRTTAALLLFSSLVCLFPARLSAFDPDFAALLAEALQTAPAMEQARRTIRSAELSRDLQTAGTRPQLGAEIPLDFQYREFRDLQSMGFSISAGGALTLSQAVPTGGTLSLSGQNVSTIVLPDEADPVVEQSARASLAFVQPVFVNGQFMDTRLFAYAERDARLGLQDAELAFGIRENETVFAVLEAYASVLLSRASVELAEMSLAHAREALRIAELRFEQGAIRFDELLAAEILRDEQNDDVFNAERSLELAVSRLVVLTGLSEDVILDRTRSNALPQLRSMVETPAPGRDPASLELERQQAERERVRIAGVLAGASDGGQLSVTVSVIPRYVDARTDNDIASSFRDLYGSSRRPDIQAGITLSVPVLDGGAAAIRREQRQLQELAASRAVERTRDEQLQRSIALYGELDASLRREARGEEQLRVSERRLARTQALISAGDATETDLRLVRLDLQRRQSELVRAQADVLIVSLQLAALRGERLLRVLSFTSPE